MKRKKILYVVTKSNWGGAQRYVYDLATSLPKSEFEPVVAFGGTGMLKEKLEKSNVSVITIPGLARNIRPFGEIIVCYRLFKIFSKEKPDIIHLNSSKIGVLGALAARFMSVSSALLHVLNAKRYTLYAPRIIFTAHGWPFFENRPAGQTFILKCLSWLTVLISDKTIAVSDHDAHAFDRWPCARGKIKKIYNGIKSEVALDKKEARAILASQYQVPVSGFLIGTIAELHRNKGLPYLIKALTLLPKSLILCIIGEGEERTNLEELSSALRVDEQVIFTGFIADAARFIAAFDIFILSSEKEGFPYVLLEAGIHGVPIIATGVGGIPEIIENKKTGLLIPPREPGALGAAISCILEHKEESLLWGHALAEKIKKDFLFDTSTLAKTYALYQSP